MEIGDKGEDEPIIGSKTSLFITLPGIASCPYSSPIDGSSQSSTLKTSNLNIASAISGRERELVSVQYAT